MVLSKLYLQTEHNLTFATSRDFVCGLTYFVYFPSSLRYLVLLYMRGHGHVVALCDNHTVCCWQPCLNCYAVMSRNMRTLYLERNEIVLLCSIFACGNGGSKILSIKALIGYTHKSAFAAPCCSTQSLPVLHEKDHVLCI